MVTETISPGPASEAIIDSITSLDRPVMVALLSWLLYLFGVTINLVVDLIYVLLDRLPAHGLEMSRGKRAPAVLVGLPGRQDCRCRF